MPDDKHASGTPARSPAFDVSTLADNLQHGEIIGSFAGHGLKLFLALSTRTGRPVCFIECGGARLAVELRDEKIELRIGSRCITVMMTPDDDAPAEKPAP